MSNRDAFEIAGSNAKLRYIDSLPASSHPVFVTAKNFKKFGYYVGTNGNGAGLIKFDDRQHSLSFPAASAISM